MLELKKSGLLLLGILVWTAPAFAQSGSRLSSGLLDEERLVQRGLTREWWSQAVMNYRRDKVTHVTNDERNVYVQCNNGVLTTFDAESGKQKWATRVGQADSPSLAASTNDEMLFVWSRATLYMLNKETGQVLKTYDLPNQPSTSAQADAEQIYLGCLDGSMYAFDIKTGKQNWRYRTSARIVVPAMPNGISVLFASTNGSLYAVEASTRNVVFEFETDNSVTAPIGRYKQLALLASEDYKLYAVDSRNGSQAWSAPFLSGGRIKLAPVVIGDDVFLTPENRGLYRIAAEDGAERWYHEGIQRFLAASPQRVYGIDRLNNLVVMDRETGETINGLSLGRLSIHVTNDRTDRIYLATTTGKIVCVRETSRPLPHYHLHPEEQPILPEFAPEATDAKDQ